MAHRFTETATGVEKLIQVVLEETYCTRLQGSPLFCQIHSQQNACLVSVFVCFLNFFLCFDPYNITSLRKQLTVPFTIKFLNYNKSLQVVKRKMKVVHNCMIINYMEKITNLNLGLKSQGGGDSAFQMTGMIECEQNSRPKKIPRTSNITPKNP